MANTYTKQTWVDGSGGGTPKSAARLGYMETGIEGAWARELGYTEFTSNVSITATTEATANTIVTAPAITFDGSTACMIEFFCNAVSHSAANAFIVFVLYDGASSIGLWGQVVTAATAGQGTPPIRLSRRLTPSSASHTYSARAHVTTGTGTIRAGAGGSGVVVPGFVRVERA